MLDVAFEQAHDAVVDAISDSDDWDDRVAALIEAARQRSLNAVKALDGALQDLAGARRLSVWSRNVTEGTRSANWASGTIRADIGNGRAMSFADFARLLQPQIGE